MKRLSRYRWNKRKKECFERDSYRCRGCNLHQITLEAVGSSLDAHHVLRRSKGGSDDLNNLISLCRRCHEKHHPEKQTRFTPGLNKMREEARKEFETLYGQEKTDG